MMQFMQKVSGSYGDGSCKRTAVKPKPDSRSDKLVLGGIATPLNLMYLFSSLKETYKQDHRLDISIQISYRHFRAAIALLFMY